MIHDIYRSRVLVGKEYGVVVGERCQECGRSCGEEHAPGCSMEQCPACRRMLIGCSCNSLCPYEAEKIIATLYAKIRSMEDALAALESMGEADTDCEKAGNSYLLHATMRYLFDNMPESKRAELESVFYQHHPQLVPQLYDEEGRRYYTADQLAEALNLPLEKVRMQIDAMAASGQGIRFANGIRLKPLH